MRFIGTISTEPDARRFCDYLLTQEIDAHAEEQTSDRAWQVWIEHDDDVDAGKIEFEQFRQSPADAKYNASSAAKKLRDAEQKQAMKRRANYRDVRTTWASASMGKYGTPVAVTLIFLCVIVGGFTQFGEKRDSPIYHALLFDYNREVFSNTEDLTREPSMFDSIKRGEVWRLVTPMFIHYGPMHLVFNLMWLWQLGRIIESRKGSLFFAMITLAISAISCTAQALWAYSLFGGMSGVVAGLLGYAWMKSRLQPYEGIHVSTQTVSYMIAWLVICSFGFVGSIANAAHWGGLAIGMMIGVVPYVVRRYLRKS